MNCHFKNSMHKTYINSSVFRYYYFIGDWVLIFAFLHKLFEQPGIPTTNATHPDTSVPLLHQLRLKDLHFFLPAAIVSSFVMYYGVCGGLQWYFYINRRHLVSLILRVHKTHSTKSKLHLLWPRTSRGIKIITSNIRCVY